MVRVLVASANRLRPAGDPGGGGGIAAAAAEADVRAYLGTEDFERECEKLASISETYRDGWRGLLRLQLTTQMATEFGQRLAELAGGRTGLAESVAAGVANKTMDPELLADAAGVGEYARRLKTVGPRTLPSVAQAAADERAAEDARRELEARLDAEAAAARAATSSVIGGQPENTQETVVDEKVKFAGQ